MTSVLIIASFYIPINPKSEELPHSLVKAPSVGRNPNLLPEYKSLTLPETRFWRSQVLISGKIRNGF